jgi:hypothetical protein
MTSTVTSETAQTRMMGKQVGYLNLHKPSPVATISYHNNMTPSISVQFFNLIQITRY